MPAIYAHDRFGKIIYKNLDGELKRVVSENYTQYRIGLQGPDIFFFYKPLRDTEVVKYGNHMHEVSAYDFFKDAVKILNKGDIKDNEYAYLIGFICHYMLDSECHGYIDHMVEEIGVPHIEIEEEFDKMLLRKDGENALSYPLSNLVPCDKKTVDSIKPFHESISSEDIERSLKDMKMLKRVFTAPGAPKQFMINTILKILGKYKDMKGLMHQRKDNLKCTVTNDGILQRFDNAVNPTVDIIKDFDESLRNGKELNKRFDRNFE